MNPCSSTGNIGSRNPQPSNGMPKRLPDFAKRLSDGSVSSKRSKLRDVIELGDHTDAPGPIPEIFTVEFFAASLHHGKSILKVPRTPYLQLLQDEIFRRYDPVVAPAHALFAPPPKDLSIMLIASAQEIDRNSRVLKPHLQVTEQRIPLLPCGIELRSPPDHERPEAVELLLSNQDEKVEIERRPRFSPERKRPGTDQRIWDSAALQRHNHALQRCVQIID